MRKIAFILAILLVLTIPTYADADISKAIRIVPGLSFSGTTATCTVKVEADSSSHPVSATVKLWQGNDCIATWNPSGTGSLNFSGTKTVTSGLQYTLTVDATVNGSTIPTRSITRTCP